MDNNVLKQGEERLSRRRRHRRWLVAVCALALVVLAGTIAALTHQAAASTTSEIEKYITAVTGKGTQYDPATGNYVSDLTIQFTVTPVDGMYSNSYTYTYPKNITIPDELLDKEYKLKSGSGNYIFSKDDEGNYGVTVSFYPEKANENGLPVDTEEIGPTIVGYITFNAQIDKGAFEEDGGFDIKFTDDCTLVIGKEDIEYKGTETLHYDLTTQKEGSFLTSENQLVYTVYVKSHKGTPEQIELTDTLDTEALKKAGLKVSLSSVSVAKGTFAQREWGDESPSIEKNADGTPKEAVKVKYDSSKEGVLSMTLPKLEAGKTAHDWQDYQLCNCYEVTYIYDLSFEGTAIAATATNKVEVRAEDKKTGEFVKDNKKKDISIAKGYTVDKNAAGEKGRVKWTIIVNKNNCNIIGAYLSDDMFAEASDFEITPDKGYKYVMDANGKMSAIQFIDDETGKNTSKYVITYYTTENTTWDGKMVNNVTFDPDLGVPGDEIGTGCTYNTGKGGTVSKNVEKTGEVTADNTVELSYSVNVSVPENGGIPAGVVFRDTLQQKWDGRKHQYMTFAQAKALVKQLKQKGWYEYFSSIVFYDLEDHAYPWSQIKDGSDVQFVKYELTVGDRPIERDENGDRYAFMLFYKATADLNDASAGDNYYHNKFEAGDHVAETDWYYYKGGVYKTDGNGNSQGSSVSNIDGSLTWKVKLTTDGMASFDKYDIIDTLPKGIELKTLEFTDGSSSQTFEIRCDDATGAMSGIGTATSGNNYKVTGTYNKETGEIALHLTYVSSADESVSAVLPAKQNYTFTYRCNVSQELVQSDKVISQKFTNNVVVKTIGAEYGAASQTQEWTKEIPESKIKEISKGGSWDNDNHEANYSIIINEGAADLIEGSDTLTLIDELVYYEWEMNDDYYKYCDTSLQQKSVKLYYAHYDAETDSYVKDDRITDWAWSFDSKTEEDSSVAWKNGRKVTKTITAEVPDATTLILEYTYDVDMSSSEKRLEFNNTAKIAGSSKKDTHDSGKWEWKKAATSGDATTGKTYKFYKVEAGNFNVLLEGAVFRIYQYNPASKQYDKTDITYTTDKKGYFGINNDKGRYELNTLYKVAEETAPKGYATTDNVYYFYYSDDKAKDNLPKKMPGNAINLSRQGYTVYVEDEKSNTVIEVDKQWFDYEGTNITETHSGFISFDLYQRSKISKGDSAGGEEVYIPSGDTSVKIRIQYGNEYGNTLKDADISETVPQGTTVHFSLIDVYGDKAAPTINYKGEKIEADSVTAGEKWKASWGSEYTQRVYHYTVSLSNKDNLITGFTSSWNEGEWIFGGTEYESPKVEAPAKDPSENNTAAEPDEKGGVLIGTYYIYSTDHWKWRSEELPKYRIDEDGNRITYTYYVVEREVKNFETSYENNEGIEEGTIIIKNKGEEILTYELPATGGPGTKWYMIGGLCISAAGIFLLYKNKKISKRKERV